MTMRIAIRTVATLGLVLAMAGTTSHAPLDISRSERASITLSSWIKATYPSQAKAREYSTVPATKRWALLIGLNNYASPTVDLTGSRQDAEELRNILLRFGWRSDHIMLIRDGLGTAQHIIDAIRWLSLKTTTASTVVFHYAGHEKYTRTTADGDNETRDVEIWAANNRYIIDGTLGREMNRVRAYRMWIDISTCRAQGFSDYGMIKTGRVLTFSSTASQYSYDVPSLHHSAFGYYLIHVGMYLKGADTNHDGSVTVEEAFWFSRPYVLAQTNRSQTPVMVDKASGNIYLNIPAH
jgi:caspase domain-containing protein